MLSPYEDSFKWSKTLFLLTKIQISKAFDDWMSQSITLRGNQIDLELSHLLYQR